MKLKKKEDQNVDTSVLLRKGKKMPMRGDTEYGAETERKPPAVILLLRIALAILEFFAFPDEFQNCSFLIFEELCWDFDGGLH